MPARPPYEFLHHLPRALNKITKMGMLPNEERAVTFITKDFKDYGR